MTILHNSRPVHKTSQIMCRFDDFFTKSIHVLGSFESSPRPIAFLRHFSKFISFIYTIITVFLVLFFNFSCTAVYQNQMYYCQYCILLTCKYLSCRAAGESLMTSEASRRARDAFCSPSAAMTLARASRAASASAAIALCNWTGSLTSLLYTYK